MRWCPAARKPRHHQIEAAPGEMDRADLAQKTRSKHGQDTVRLDKQPPEAVGGLGVIGGMSMILLEADRILDLARHGPDPHVETERAHSAPLARMEEGNRPMP